MGCEREKSLEGMEKYFLIQTLSGQLRLSDLKSWNVCITPCANPVALLYAYCPIVLCTVELARVIAVLMSVSVQVVSMMLLAERYGSDPR